MSAPSYLEGVRRTPPPRMSPRLGLALWVVLLGLFTAIFVFVRNAQPPRVEGFPGAVAVAPAEAPLLDRPGVVPAADALLFGVGVLTLAWLLRSQRRVLTPLRRAKLALAEGDAERATGVLHEALRERYGRAPRAALLFGLGQVAAEQGHFAESLEVYAEAETTLGPAPRRSQRETSDFRVLLRMARAESLLALGRLDEAEVELTPMPAAWMPTAHAQAVVLTVRLAAGRRDHATVLRLLDEHATSNERRLTLRDRWLLRAVEHLARDGRVPSDALPDDPPLRRWIAARVPGLDLPLTADGGAA